MFFYNRYGAQVQIWFIWHRDSKLFEPNNIKIENREVCFLNVRNN